MGMNQRRAFRIPAWTVSASGSEQKAEADETGRRILNPFSMREILSGIFWKIIKTLDFRWINDFIAKLNLSYGGLWLNSREKFRQ